MTSGSSMQAMIRIAPPQAGQVSMSIPNTRLRRCAEVIAARRSACVGSSGSAMKRAPQMRCKFRAVGETQWGGFVALRGPSRVE